MKTYMFSDDHRAYTSGLLQDKKKADEYIAKK